MPRRPPARLPGRRQARHRAHLDGLRSRDVSRRAAAAGGAGAEGRALARDGATFMPALINVVKIVTAFTVAHSVTLTLAALGLVHLPGRFVEVVIAASIAIAAARHPVSGLPRADLARRVRLRPVPRLRVRRRARGDGRAARASRAVALRLQSRRRARPARHRRRRSFRSCSRCARWRPIGTLAPAGRGRGDDRRLDRLGAWNGRSTVALPTPRGVVAAVRERL